MQTSNQSGAPSDVFVLITICWLIVVFLNLLHGIDWLRIALASTAAVLAFLSAWGRKPIENKRLRIVFWLTATVILFTFSYVFGWRV